MVLQRDGGVGLRHRHELAARPALGHDELNPASRQLAQELGYKGDMNDSASMNIWLHQQVMKKLAENSGKVPETLKH